MSNDDRYLFEIITENMSKGPHEIMRAIQDEFLVIRNDTSRAKDDPPKPAVGQLWRNKTSRRLVAIYSIGWQSIKYRVVDGSRGQKSGDVYPHYWTSRFEFVSGSKEQE